MILIVLKNIKIKMNILDKNKIYYYRIFIKVLSSLFTNDLSNLFININEPSLLIFEIYSFIKRALKSCLNLFVYLNKRI